MKSALDISFAARGIGGAVTGFSIDSLLVIDDLIKGPEDVSTKSRRDKTWEQVEAIIMSRLSENTPCIAINTRWHNDDYAGRLEKQFGWRVYNFPALSFGDGDLLERRKNSALVPALKSEKFLQDIKKNSLPHIWSALYEGRPTSKETARFDRATFRYYEESPVEISRRLRVYQFTDTAGTDSETSDYFVTITVGIESIRNPEPMEFPTNIYVLDVKRKRLQTTQHAEEMKQSATQWKPICQYVEKSVFGLHIIQSAKQRGLNIQPLIADRSKWLRSEEIATAYFQGKVMHPRPENAPWLDDFENEMAAFPGSEHDDQVDCIAYAGIIAKKLATSGINRYL
jgi:predicted phage terminase large subunit-like protein